MYCSSAKVGERSREKPFYTVNRVLESGNKPFFLYISKDTYKHWPHYIRGKTFGFINKTHDSFSPLVFLILACSVCTCLWYF